MDLNVFNASKFLAKHDLPPNGLRLTIASFGIETMRDNTKKPSVSWLEPGIKPMLLNKTNIDALKVIAGTSQTEAMIGRQVHVYNDATVSMGGQVVGGLRIKPLAAPTPPTSVGPPADFDDKIPY